MACMVSSSAENAPTLTWERSAFKLPVGSTLIDSLQMMVIDRSTPNISDTNSPYPDTVHTNHQYQKVLDLSNAFLAHVQVFSS